MDFDSARRAVFQLLSATAPADVPALLHWMRTTRKQSWLELGGWLLALIFGYRGGPGLDTGSLGGSRPPHISHLVTRVHFTIGCLGTHLRWFVIPLLLLDRLLEPLCSVTRTDG